MSCLRIPEVGNQFMVYIDRINHLDEMTVEVEINRSYFSGELAELAKIQKKVVKELHDTLELRTTVNLVEPGSLPRFEGKAKRVIDRRGDNLMAVLGSKSGRDASGGSPESPV